MLLVAPLLSKIFLNVINFPQKMCVGNVMLAQFLSGLKSQFINIIIIIQSAHLLFFYYCIYYILRSQH